jgi:ABC-type nickel/cobalt efflux system permease component RcnA
MTIGITEGASMGVAMVVTIGAWWIFSRTSGLRQRKGKKDAAHKDASEKPSGRKSSKAMTGRSVVGTEGGPAARVRAIHHDGSASDTGAPTASRGEETLVAETSQSSGLCGLLKRSQSPTDVEKGPGFRGRR